MLTAAGIGVGHLAGADSFLLFFAKFVLLILGTGAVALAIGRRWLGEARTLDAVKNLALLFATTLVMAGLGEVALRRAYSGITTTADNSSYWANRWRRTHIRRNQLGFREREIPAKKPAGTYRIAVIGDSFAFGQGIEEQERFSNLLEGRLNQGGKRYEVLNFGVAGTSTTHQIKILKDVVEEFDPDFVLLQWFANDVEGDQKISTVSGVPLLPSATLRTALHRHSALYYVLEVQWAALQQRLGLTKGYEESIRERFRDSSNTSSREAEASLAEFVRESRERSLPVGMVLFSLMDKGPQSLVFDFLVERVVAFCDRERIECLDMREPIRRTDRGNLTLNRFDTHPNAEANRIAAEELLKRFGPIWNRVPTLAPVQP